MSEKNEVKKVPEKAVLGDIPILLTRDENGYAKLVKGIVTLEEAKGHIAVIQNKSTVTATGFRELNKIAGISLITPNDLKTPDGRTVPNPYLILDDKGKVKAVWARQMAIGFTPSGSMAVTSATVYYDVQMYLIRDLVKKIKDDANIGKYCTQESLTLDEKKAGMFLPIDEFIGIWVNLQHKDVLKCLETYVENKNFADRKAQTIAERNAMKKHPALSFPIVDGQGAMYNKVAKVKVLGYSRNINKAELLDLIEKAKDGNLEEFQGIPIEQIEEVITEISDEDDQAGNDEEMEIVNEAQEVDFVEVKEEADKGKLLEEIKKALEDLGITEADIKEDINKMGKASLSELNEVQLKVILKRLG